MIRLIEAKDALPLEAFLNHTFETDPKAGGIVQERADKMTVYADDKELCWVCEEDGEIVGMIGPVEFGKGEVTWVHFNLLVVDHEIYEKDKERALKIAKELSLAAAEGIRDAKREPDEIRISGRKDSRGASWARDYLKFEEIPTKGNGGEWRLPFKEIWERIEAV